MPVYAVPLGAREDWAVWSYVDKINQAWGKDWPLVIEWFEDLDARWDRPTPEKIRLKIIGSSALMLQTSYERGTKDSDVLELTVKQRKPAAKLNGKDIDVTSIQVAANALATCLCNGEPLSPKAMGVPAKANAGIGLQAETGKFEFRNIRIKELAGAATSAR